MAAKKSKVGKIEALPAYRTTDGKVYHGTGAKKEAQEHQAFLNIQKRAETLSMQILDFFGTGLFRLSNGPDEKEAVETARKVISFFNNNVGGMDEDLDDDVVAEETFTSLAHIFIDFEQQFPGVLMKISELIQFEFHERGRPRTKK